MPVLDGALTADGSGARTEDRVMYGENITSRSLTTSHTGSPPTQIFKDRLVKDMERGMKSLSKPARNEIVELDVTLIHEAARAIQPAT